MSDMDGRPAMLHLGLTWEQTPAGFSYRTAARTVTEADLASFVNLAGFNEPLFYDARHGAAAGYTGRLVPGALVYVLAEGLIQQSLALHGTGVAFMHMELTLSAPTYVGDTLYVVVETLESRATRRPGRGAVTTRCSVINQNDVTVAVFTPVRLIRGADEPTETAPCTST
jgi:acyl dehydratase